MLTGQFYGFSDVIERNRKRIYVRFDIIESKTLARLKRRRKKLSEVLPELETWLIELEMEINKYKQFRGLNGRTLLENRWYAIKLEKEGVQAQLFSSPTQPERGSVKVSDVSFIDRRSSKARQLEQIVSLNEIQDAQSEDILNVLKSVGISGYIVTCYNVGQGNCNAICDRNSFPLVYFDFGGGCGRNAHTFPANTKPCLSNKQPIILSHWDMDHWTLGIRFPEAESSKWIVPRQSPIGISHMIFAHRVHSKENLLIWPNSLPSLSTPLGEIYKLPQHSNRNYSGLVMAVRTSKINAPSSSKVVFKTLLPGDAPYRRIPNRASLDLNALVVTHHGGNYRNDWPPSPIRPHKFAYSYGNGNSYRHPNPTATLKHSNAGWHNRFNTCNGNISLEPLLNSLPQIPCGGQCCSFQLVQ